MIKEYNNKCKQKLGYKDNVEYKRMYKWNKGINSPMSENENCASYVGNYIGEDIGKIILSMIFEEFKIMSYGNEGFDVICKNPRKYGYLKRMKLSDTGNFINLEVLV